MGGQPELVEDDLRELDCLHGPGADEEIRHVPPREDRRQGEPADAVPDDLPDHRHGIHRHPGTDTEVHPVFNYPGRFGRCHEFVFHRSDPLLPGFTPTGSPRQPVPGMWSVC